MSACGSRAPAGAAAHAITVGSALAADQTLVRALDTMPRSFDPSLLTDVDAQHVCDEIFEGLMAFGPDGSMVGGVASSWETSPDGKTWTFHLRPEARWSNGDPVTAADFVYAWKREVDPKTGTEYAQALAPIVNALAIAKGDAPVDSLGAAAPDPHTVRLSLNSPTPYLLYLLADSFMQPLHRATIEKYGENWTRPGNIVSNGPFILREAVVGNRITLEKNPYYWDTAHVRLTRVIFYPLEDTEIQVSRYLAGDLAVTSKIPLSRVAPLREMLGDQVVVGPYNGTDSLSFNMVSPPFGHSRELRLALSMALDRKVISRYVYHGVQQPAYTEVPRMPGYDPPVPAWADWSDAQRIAEARRLYAAAGYSKDHPLRVQLDFPTAGANRDLWDAMAAMWRTALGAEVEPYNEEFRVLLQDLRLHKSKLFWNGWIGDYPDPYTFLQIYETGYGQNFGLYSNPAYDAELHKAANEPDPALRLGDLARAETILNEDAGNLPFLYESSLHLLKPYVTGWHGNLQDRVVSRYLAVLEHQGD